jgi:hypothetical protein
MNRTYWVKKNPESEKEETEWYEMSGIEFYKFITAPENKNRYFINFYDMKIEANKHEYTEWRKEQNHRNYLKQQERQFKTISLDEFYLNGDLYNNAALETVFLQFEEEIERTLISEKIKAALHKLALPEQLLIYELILSDKVISDRKLSMLIGIPHATLNKRKRVILNKLKKYLKKY